MLASVKSERVEKSRAPAPPPVPTRHPAQQTTQNGSQRSAPPPPPARQPPPPLPTTTPPTRGPPPSRPPPISGSNTSFASPASVVSSNIKFIILGKLITTLFHSLLHHLHRHQRPSLQLFHLHLLCHRSL